jgi:hypothetical protein
MTDRELLELSAKAAFGGKNFIGDMRWNPLTDDGDALRLAVKLRLWVQISERSVWIAQNADEIFGDMAASTFLMVSDCGGDACEATRRAIVRAAAEIGRAASKGKKKKHQIGTAKQPLAKKKLKDKPRKELNLAS